VFHGYAVRGMGVLVSLLYSQVVQYTE
jgi:hypothetical protein